MSVRLKETSKSRKYELNGRTATGNWQYIAFAESEADPEDAVYIATSAVAPLRWNGLFRQSMECSPLGGYVYEVNVPYALLEGGAAPDPTQPADTGDSGYPSTPSTPGENDTITNELSLEITGQPVKIQQSIFTLSKTLSPNAPAGTVATDYMGAINVDKDGKVEGVDSAVPILKFSITKVFPSVTWKYIVLLRELYGQTNISQWGVFGPNEVRFVGASLQSKDDGQVPIKFDFEAIQSETNVDVGNGIVVPNKPGWYYLWVEYGKQAQAGARKLPSRPQCAYVERIFKHDDFSKLGLG